MELFKLIKKFVIISQCRGMPFLFCRGMPWHAPTGIRETNFKFIANNYKSFERCNYTKNQQNPTKLFQMAM